MPPARKPDDTQDDAPSAAEQRHAEVLENKAEKAEERADAAQEKAEELEAKAEAAAKAAEDAGGPKDDHCPDCGTRLMHYDGVNPHKSGQGYCRKCQARKPLGH